MSKTNKKKRKNVSTAPENPVPIIYENKPKRNKTLIIAVAAFISLVLILGGVLLTVTLVKNSKYVASYDGFGMDEKTAKYFASVYKQFYIAGLPSDARAEDTPEFWAKIPEGGKRSYGEDLKAGYEDFIRTILAANSVFSAASSLNSSMKEDIAHDIEIVMSDYAINNNTDAFNAAVSKYGFDYEALKSAAELWYRYKNACASLYGAGGEFISVAGAEEYLSEYSYVKIIFVDDDKLAQNKDGIRDNIAALSQAVKTHGETGGEGAGSVTPEMFSANMKYNSVSIEGGVACEYYFHENSDWTVKIGNTNEDIHAVVETAITMKVGEFAEADYPNGKCYIYKCEPQRGAYANTDYEIYFEDFYTDAAEYLYQKTIKLSTESVKLKESFYSIDIISIPQNYSYRLQ